MLSVFFSLFMFITNSISGINEAKNQIRTNDLITARDYKLFQTVGIVTGVTDGIVTILGMSNVAYGETVDILTTASPVVCLVLNVERDKIGAIALDTDVNIKPVYMQFAVAV